MEVTYMLCFRRVLLAAVLALAIASCTSPDPADPPAPPAPVQAPSPQAQAGDDAVAAYNSFWVVALKARAAPGDHDWSPELAAVASGEALASLKEDITNYANFPAHNEGTVERSPAVENATTDRVEITDCLDLTKYVLRADHTNELLTDTANQVPRFRYRADVVRNPAGTWLVDRTTASVDQPC
jgi:hypothetical protein